MLQTIISIIFYIAFILYIFQGVYCLALNKAALLNRVFFFVCLSFAIWAFAFAISNSLTEMENVLNWRRVASLGWGVAFSVIVHFILILTGEQKLLKTKGIYGVLYIPAAITVFIFGIYGNLAKAQYNLVHTPAGWGNVPVNNIWDSLYNLYYISFSFVTLVLLFKGFKNSVDEGKRKQARWLILSFSVAIAIGTVSEMLVNTYWSFKIPSIAPIIILIPVMTFAYSIKKYGLTAPGASKKAPDSSVILSDYTHTTFVRYIAAIYLCVSLFNLFLTLFYQTRLLNEMLFSTICVSLSLVIYALTFSGWSTKGQDRVLTVIMMISIPMTLWHYHENPLSNALWTVPLILMMMTIIFSYKNMLGAIVVVSFITELFLWLHIPEVPVHVGGVNYLSRLALYGMGIVLAAYINRIYIVRLKENDQQVKFQKMITKITTNFVAVTKDNFDEKVNDLLMRSGSLIHADRAYLGIYSDDRQMVTITQEWQEQGIKTVMGETVSPEPKTHKWSNSQLADNHIVLIDTQLMMPIEAETECRWLDTQHVFSRICIPIQNKDGIIGFIGFDQITGKQAWQLDDLDLLRVLTNVLSDAIAKVEIENEMNYLAYYDVLTGLPNRILFQNRLAQAIELAKRSARYLGVMFIDIDGFKDVNDSLGHNWGDHLLKKIGNRISDCIRQYDTVARFGGDEFLIMLPQIAQQKDLEVIAAKIMNIFRQPINLGGQDFYITASGGVSVFPADGETVNALIKNADLAMYAAKKKGKGQVSFCSGDMKDAVLEKMTLTNSLYRALERQELFLQYQPQIAISTQEIIGFEALIRWKHPTLGLISPGVFIPIAEQTGLINSIGEWVLLTACKQNKSWQDQGYRSVQMAVNLSLEQFRSGNIEKTVKKCLDNSGLDPQYLELEITEGIAMKDSGYVVNCLHGLKALGVAISIDDFGTEFSSLSRLKDLPVDRLKIDMQFIRGIGINDKDESIIAVMIHLAKRLGLKVIAEGVETKGQMGFLKNEDCDEIQGFYYYRPLSVDEIEVNQLQLFKRD